MNDNNLPSSFLVLHTGSDGERYVVDDTPEVYGQVMYAFYKMADESVVQNCLPYDVKVTREFVGRTMNVTGGTEVIIDLRTATTRDESNTLVWTDLEQKRILYDDLRILNEDSDEEEEEDDEEDGDGVDDAVEMDEDVDVDNVSDAIPPSSFLLLSTGPLNSDPVFVYNDTPENVMAASGEFYRRGYAEMCIDNADYARAVREGQEGVCCDEFKLMRIVVGSTIEAAEDILDLDLEVTDTYPYTWRNPAKAQRYM